MHSAARGLLVFLVAFFFLAAQEPVPAPDTPPAGGGAAGALSRLGLGGASGEPQAYDKVITKDAKTKTGLFTVHEIKEKYYYEIPKTELNKELLFVTQIAKHHSRRRLRRPVRLRARRALGAQRQQDQPARSEL